MQGNRSEKGYWESSWNAQPGVSQKPYWEQLPGGYVRTQPLPVMKSSRRSSQCDAKALGVQPPAQATKVLPSSCPARLPDSVWNALRPLQVLQESLRAEEKAAWFQKPDSSVVNWLANTIDKGESVDWDLVNTSDVIGYFKRRLAEFGPLLAKDLWVRFALAECTTPVLRQCLRALPEANRKLTVQFLFHLHKLAIKDKQFAISVLGQGFEQTVDDMKLQITAMSKRLAIAVLAPALANDQLLTDINIQLKAQWMIENAPDICDMDQV